MQTYSAEYLAEDFSHWPRVGIYLTFFVAIFLMLLRIYARVVLIKWFGLDDFLMVLAVVSNTVVMILSIKVIDYGAGKHIAAISPVDLDRLFEHLVAVQLMYLITLWLCRISALAFYARITAGIVELQTILVISWVVVSLTLVAQLLFVSLECIPLEKLWNRRLKGKCLGDVAVFSPTVGTIVCDCLVLVIPIAIIAELNVTAKRKLLLAFVMCFGVFSVFASIFRILAIIPTTRATTTDPTQYFAQVAVWSNTEIVSAMIALCMPSLKPIFHRLFSDSPTSSDQNSPNHSANPDDSLHRIKEMHRQKYRARIPTGTTKDMATTITTVSVNESEENLWVHGTIVSADSHGKMNSSSHTLIEMDTISNKPR